MDSRPYLLIVDDEIMNLHILTDLLEDRFDIHTVNNGQECLDSLQEKTPDLILLDVMMPVLNGLDTCRQIRANPLLQDIPVIFVSALASSKERLNGYEAGGDDYLTKPFDEDELLAKINLLLKINSEIKQGIEDKEYATKTAMTSMISASEAGHLMSFMQAMLTINDIDSLHQQLSDVLDNYGLNACIMLNHLEQAIFWFSDGRIRPIEQDILKEARQGNKIIEFSGRAIFNSDHVGILVRKLPDDDEMSGRYKDHLAVLIDSLEAKLVQFMADHDKQQHYLSLQQTIESISRDLNTVSQSYQQQRSLNTAILGELAHHVEKSFIKFGLEESQEEILIQLIHHAETETDKVYENGKQSEITFERIVTELNQLLNPSAIK